MTNEPEQPATPPPAEASSLLKAPPFKRGLPAQPLVSVLPSKDADPAIEATSALLFNDVSPDGPVCDPNDPDCEIV